MFCGMQCGVKGLHKMTMNFTTRDRQNCFGFARTEDMIKRSGGPAGHRCRFTVLPPVAAASGARLAVAENCSDLCTRLPASVGTCRPVATCCCCCYCRTGGVCLSVPLCALLSLTAFIAVCCCLAAWLPGCLAA